MALGIGIGMGIGGASQNTSTGYFEILTTCAFTKPAVPFTSFLIGVPYKPGDYVQTEISGPYAGKRILLGNLFAKKPGNATVIGVEPGSLVYNACQI